jgi:hypothetical protein
MLQFECATRMAVNAKKMQAFFLATGARENERDERYGVPVTIQSAMAYCAPVLVIVSVPLP